MTFEGLTFAGLFLALPLNWIVTGILGHAAWEKPRIRFLTFVAVFSAILAWEVSIYVGAVVNAALGYPISRDIVVAVLRLSVFGLALMPLSFLYMYLAGQFRDGAP